MAEAIPQNLKLVRLYDKEHPDLYQFRIQVIRECGGRAGDISQQGSYSKITRELKTRGLDQYEDIYKFSDAKWGSLTFDHIDAIYSGADICCVSGARNYDGWLRFAMMYYGLESHRKVYDSILFKADGIAKRLEVSARDQGLKGLFFTIFPYSRALQVLCDRLKNNKGLPTRGEIDVIREFQYRGSAVFNGVSQDFFVNELGDETFDPALFLESH